MDLVIEIVAGMLGAYLTWFVVSRGISKASNADTEGRLYFGGFLVGLAAISSIIAISMIWVLFFVDHGGQETSIAILIIMFGTSAIYCWFEYIWTKGFITEEGIGFQSLWKGRRHYQWPDLVSVKYNNSFYWYVLTFKNGSQVRLSVYLHGYLDVLEKLDELGHDF